jgi:acetolactate synthase I/II/III large subunit
VIIVNVQKASRSGGRILVDQLQIQGVERLTCVPGESFLAVLDALHDASIDVLVCRQEGGAAIMAEAYGKLTGRPGICFVTRGPGSMNGSHGIHIAAQDSTPMIMFVGQVERGMLEREAFQELDYKAVFGSIAKWVVEIDSAERIPELVARAFRVAMQGRPGPVVVSLPEDILTDLADVADAPRIEPVDTIPADEDMKRLGEMVKAAKRPFMIVGGSRWSAEACKSVADFAARAGIPVAASFRRAQLFPADHPNFAGDLGIGPNPKLAARVKEADLLLLIGGRMSETPSSAYTLIDVPVPKQKLVHVHPGAEELGRVYQPALAIQASPIAFAAKLATLDIGSPRGNAEEAATAHADYLAWSDNPRKLPGRFQYGEVMCWLRDKLPADAIICNGAGNYAGWIHRFFRFRQFGTQLAPTSGSMGYGLPAAVLAKRQYPGKVVVAFAGDGCFLMNGQEFATAVQFGIPFITVVVDNGMYGTIRMHQENHYPHRVSATDLTNPDFAALAKAYGGHGERVETTEEFAPAFERALVSGKPAILHCLLDPQAISAGRTIDELRQAAMKS